MLKNQEKATAWKSFPNWAPSKSSKISRKTRANWACRCFGNINFRSSANLKGQKSVFFNRTSRVKISFQNICSLWGKLKRPPRAARSLVNFVKSSSQNYFWPFGWYSAVSCRSWACAFCPLLRLFFYRTTDGTLRTVKYSVFLSSTVLWPRAFFGTAIQHAGLSGGWAKIPFLSSLNFWLLVVKAKDRINGTLRM